MYSDRRKRNIAYEGGRETLRKLLRKMGFKYVRKNGTRFLMERRDVTLARLEFLRRFAEVVAAGYDLVFIDETWVFRKGTGKGWAWENSDPRSCSFRHASLGERYVVLSAGGRDGFVPGATEIFATKKKPLPYEDYHGDMNADKYLHWLRHRVLPNLAKPSVLIKDNAAYHRKQARTFQFGEMDRCRQTDSRGLRGSSGSRSRLARS